MGRKESRESSPGGLTWILTCVTAEKDPTPNCSWDEKN